MEMYDFRKQPVKHGKARVNGILMHYVTAGQGPVILLLHGTPKTNCYWYQIMPILSEKFTVVAPDLRGFGYTDKPGATEGYDSLTNVEDLYELMKGLGYDRFYIHGEDRGAEYGFVYAAKHPEQVIAMSYGEMAVSGYGIEEASYFTEENIIAQYNNTGKWLWHVPFFFVQNIPEMLLEGHECEFWDALLKMSAYNPDSLSDELMDEYNSRFTAPGGMRGILETYRAEIRNMHINRDIVEKHGKLSLPVVTVGGIEFYGVTVKDHAAKIFSNIKNSTVLTECGHHLANEQPEKLAKVIEELLEFK
jgi:pimeloyl-ACP methyl ester carboxylesterase